VVWGKSMKAKWRRREEKVREVLERELGVPLPEKKVLLIGTDTTYKFDMVSPDGTIVGETKTYTWRGKRIPYAKIAHASEACLFLLHAKDAKNRLLVLTDPEFYKHYVRSRQGSMVQADGITIRLA
jgi:hypothetical protein